jgi:hypothetical protein
MIDCTFGHIFVFCHSFVDFVTHSYPDHTRIIPGDLGEDLMILQQIGLNFGLVNICSLHALRLIILNMLDMSKSRRTLCPGFPLLFGEVT